MATKVGVLKEKKIEDKYFGSPNKLVEEDSSSRPARKIFLAKGQGSAFPAGKVLDFGENEAPAGSKPMKAKPVEEDSVSRAACKLVPCKVCVAKGEDGGCHICVAKASALQRIKLAGGDIIVAAAVAEKDTKAKPFTSLTRSCLDRMKAAGGHVIRERATEGGVVVTVKLPDTYVKDIMSIPPPTPLTPLPEDFFQYHPTLREATRVGTAAVLYTLTREEMFHAQYFRNGFVVVDFGIVKD